MSEASDGYSEDFDEAIDSDPGSRTPYYHKKSSRKKTPAFKLYRPEGQVKEFTSNVRNRQVANRGANSLPILGRGNERAGLKERSPLRPSKRMVSHDAGKPPSDRVLSANLRTIRSLQSALKEKELQIEQLAKENRLYKRFDILAQKEVTRIEKEHKNVPELIKRHETEIALHKERFKKLQKDNFDLFRRKEQLERELGQSKLKFAELKKISENKNLEERHQLSLRLQEEMDRSEQLGQRLQEANKKLALQEKSTKREKAELEEKCKKREKRIYLMEQNVREMVVEMSTKKKQLEKLNLYSLRIEKNLPASMNLSDFLPSQEDRGTMTSPLLSESTGSRSEPRFSLPPTRSQNQTSSSVHLPRNPGTQRQRQSLPPSSSTSGAIHLASKPQFTEGHSNISPPMTHSEPGNYSESDTMPTLLTSSDLTNFTTNPTPTEVKTTNPTPTEVKTTNPTPTEVKTTNPTPTEVKTTNPTPTEVKTTPNPNDTLSPPMQPISTDPPLSTIRENSTFADSSAHQSLKKSLQYESPRIPNNPPVNYNSTENVAHPERKQYSENQPITSTQKEALLKRLKEIDTVESASTIESPQTLSLTSTRDSQSLRDSDRRPENLDSKTLALKHDRLSGESATPVNQSETGGRGRKKKVLALDDLFSDASSQNSTTKLQASNNMDPGIFSAPNEDTPTYLAGNKLKQNSQREESSPNLKHAPPTVQDRSTTQANDDEMNEQANGRSKRASVVENMFHGKPAYSTEEDFYGSNFVHSSPNKTPTQNPFDFDSTKKPQHGRRARETDSPTQPDSEYYWENKVTQSKPINSHRVSTPVDDIEDDLEVIEL